MSLTRLHRSFWNHKIIKKKLSGWHLIKRIACEKSLAFVENRTWVSHAISLSVIDSLVGVLSGWMAWVRSQQAGRCVGAPRELSSPEGWSWCGWFMRVKTSLVEGKRTWLTVDSLEVSDVKLTDSDDVKICDTVTSKPDVKHRCSTSPAVAVAAGQRLTSIALYFII